MHELSIATALVEQIMDIARQNHCSRVDQVGLETGVLRQVVPELMETAFIEASKGTLAEGAVLRVTEARASARCRQCRAVFEPELDNYICPHCDEADTEILAGNDIVLKEISGT